MLNMMKSTFEQIFTSYSQYVGCGAYMILFFVSLLYIYILDLSKENKGLLFYYPLISIVIIFNPIIAHTIIAVIEEQVYWRIFWILPITAVIAYVATSTVLHISEKYRKVLMTVALIAIIAMCGKFIFTTENYSISSNMFKLPIQTIEVCNILEKTSKGEIIRVVAPAALTESIRQYDANIQMAYGRDGAVIQVDYYSDRHILFERMQESELNVESISKAMDFFECNYLVIFKSASLSDNLANYGYQYIASTDSYDIYRFNYEEMTMTG